MIFYCKRLNLLLTLCLFAAVVNAQQSKSMYFDGTNGIIRAPHSKVLYMTSAGTIEAWIKPLSFNNEAGIIHKGDATDFSDEQYSVHLTQGNNGYNKVCFIIGRSSGTSGTHFNKLESQMNLNTNTWYHIVACWNSTTMYIYINGVLDVSKANTVRMANFTGGLNIGSMLYGNASKYPFKGYIDEVRIWNTTRSQTLIRENMYLQQTGKESGLKAYYHFEENNSDTVKNNTPSIVESITLTKAGSNYSVKPTISFSGGGGNGAVASVASLKINNISIGSGGSGYKVNNSLNLSGGSYKTRAVFKVTSISGSNSGPVTGVSVTNPGNYTSLPANPVSVSGGNGTGAKFILGWTIISLSLTNNGSGYTSQPIVVFNPTGAEAIANLSDINALVSGGASHSDNNSPYGHLWTGASSTSWGTAANWFAAWLPTKNIPVMINSSAVRNCIVTANAECGKLFIEKNGNLTVNAGITLKAYGNSYLDGIFTLETASLKTGNFIDNGTITYGGNDNVSLKKLIKANQWHYNSSPVKNSSSNVFWGMAVYSYAESDGNFNNRSVWKAIRNDDTLKAMASYDIYVKNQDKTMSFKGEFHTGEYSRTDLSNINDGYNFIGNPYPSVIDWLPQPAGQKQILIMLFISGILLLTVVSEIICRM